MGASGRPLAWMGPNPSAGAGGLIAFEGVDGAGKSTAVQGVAEHLRARGHRVFLPRIGKEHSSRSTRMIRNLTRDRRNLDLSARSELLLYCAREAQVLHELVRPALSRGELVLIDRSLLTPVVLGRARGLPGDECEQSAALAADGLEPDLTLVFDVHPRTSRIRKRLERIQSDEYIEGGRKGLSGSALKERVRALYSEVAQARGYPVFHVERASKGELRERVLNMIEHGPAAGTGESELDRIPQWLGPADWTLEEGLRSLPIPVALFLSNGLLAARALRREASGRWPALAAWAMDPDDPLREVIAEQQPRYALRGLGRRPLSGDDDLRLRLLARDPAAALSALRHVATAEADAIRARYAEAEPDAVLASLTGREDERAESLRDRCWKAGSDRGRADSLAFCVGERAWKRREKLFDKHPVLGLATLRGIDDPRADRWLERYADAAPKRVLSALGGRGDARAFALREALFDTGREVIDSLRGQNEPAAWALRERALSRWPSTVVHSLFGLQAGQAVTDMLEQCRRQAPGDLHVLRRIQGLAERPLLPDWATARASLHDDDEGGD